jgi:hypothetical protein
MVLRRVVDTMVADGQEPTVGGATSIGLARKFGFDLCSAMEPDARLVLKGLDLKTEVGKVGEYYCCFQVEIDARQSAPPIRWAGMCQ